MRRFFTLTNGIESGWALLGFGVIAIQQFVSHWGSSRDLGEMTRQLSQYDHKAGVTVKEVLTEANGPSRSHKALDT